MLPILLYITGFFWLLAILEAAVLPFWTGDFILVLLFIWSLYVAVVRERKKLPIFNLWYPLLFGLGMTSFLFFSRWILLPYAVAGLLLTMLILKKSKWIFRFKEGVSSYLVIFTAFVVTLIFVRLYIIGYSLGIELWIRFFITFVFGLVVWTYFTAAAKRGKIR